MKLTKTAPADLPTQRPNVSQTEMAQEQHLLRAAGALLAYGIDPLADAFSIDPAKAVASARAAAAALGRAPGDTTAASAATSRPVPVDPMEAARLAAAQIARQPGVSTGESAATAPPSAGGAATTEADRAAAAAAFAASLTGHKRSRWGEGSTQLVAVGDGGGTGGASSAAAKNQQALVVSQLSDKLAAFRHKQTEAVKNAKPADIAALKEVHERLESAARDGRIDAFFEANQEFHKKILDKMLHDWKEDEPDFLVVTDGHRNLYSPRKLPFERVMESVTLPGGKGKTFNIYIKEGDPCNIKMQDVCSLSNRYLI